MHAQINTVIQKKLQPCSSVGTYMYTNNLNY